MSLLNTTKEDSYFVVILKEAQHIQDGIFIYPESREELDDIVMFYLKYGWLPKNIKDIKKEYTRIVEKPGIKLMIYKQANRIRKRPKKLGGNLVE